MIELLRDSLSTREEDMNETLILRIFLIEVMLLVHLDHTKRVISDQLIDIMLYLQTHN